VPVALSWGPIGAVGGARRGAVVVLQDLSGAQAWRAHVLQTEKMASIGQLAAGVAHEINNPMGFIHANLFQMTEYVTDLRQVWTRVEGLLKAVEGGDDALLERSASELAHVARELDVGFVLQDLGKAIRESQEGSERIRHIVQDLRDFSHQDTGERVLADINQCLDSTANIVWPMMKHLVKLSKDYAELPSVPCYPMQLKQVFMNLLVNAYQAIEEAAAEDARPGWIGTVTLTTEATEEGVVVQIADTGAGIAAEHLDRIFDPFFTTKKVGAGTGLGLSTSFNIVRRHGGTLRVESRRGVGTTFRLQLPLLSEVFGSEPG
jgi:signal transduction histidine kinase